jgi:hypothetical protein
VKGLWRGGIGKDALIAQNATLPYGSTQVGKSGAKEVKIAF